MELLVFFFFLQVAKYFIEQLTGLIIVIIIVTEFLKNKNTTNWRGGRLTLKKAESYTPSIQN